MLFRIFQSGARKSSYLLCISLKGVVLFLYHVAIVEIRGRYVFIRGCQIPGAFCDVYEVLVYPEQKLVNSEILISKCGETLSRIPIYENAFKRPENVDRFVPTAGNCSCES